MEIANPTPSCESQSPPQDSAKISSSDPDATWATKGGVPAQLSYYDNYLIDNESNVILDVEATRARFLQEVVAARAMVERVEATFAIQPQSLGADKAYGSGEFLAWLLDRDIAPHIRVMIGRCKMPNSSRATTSSSSPRSTRIAVLPANS